MGNGLGDAYTATLDRIREQPGDRPRLGMMVSMWVSLAERPLRVRQLCQALAVRIGPSRSTDLDRENIPLIQTLLGCCLGLVVVEEEASTVRLLRSTLQDYLCGHPNIFHNAHATMAEVCLTYLNFKSVRGILSIDDDEWIPPGLPFLSYASCYWGVHAKKEITEPVILLALKLLSRYQCHIASALLFSHYDRQAMESWDPPHPPGFTALHCVAAFGISELLVDIDFTGVNQSDDAGRTPLTYAAANGHEQVLKVLLDQTDAGINYSDKLGLTPLLWAACGDSEEVMRLLVERKDVNPSLTSKWGQTALHLAADVGNKGIANILLSSWADTASWLN